MPRRATAAVLIPLTGDDNFTVPNFTPPPPCGFLLTARRRVRHWTDGLVIGSELFVREAVRRARPALAKTSHRLARSEPAPGTPEPLFCWRRLRPATG